MAKQNAKTTPDTQPFRIYMSHQIRGPKGDAATAEDIANNIKIAKGVGTEIQAYAIDWEKMDGFPPIHIYIPAEHDEFVQIAYINGYLTETQILACDCEIINRCQLLLIYGDTLSRGMQIEERHAIENNIPIFRMPVLCRETIEALQFVIHLLLTREGK